MGLFGGLMGALGKAGKFYTSPQGLETIGAILSDYGDGGNRYGEMRKLQLAQAQKQQQMQALQSLSRGLFGGQAGLVGAGPNNPGDGTNPAFASPLGTNNPSVTAMAEALMAGDPNAPSLDAVTARQPAPKPQPAQKMLSPLDAARMFAQANAMGVDTSGLMDAYKLAQPEIAFSPSNEAINTRDPGMVGKVFPKVGENQILVRDANGNVQSVMLVPGAAEAVQTMEGAKTAGQRDAALIDVPLADGRTVKMPGSAFMQAMESGTIPGLGIRPSQAQTAADTEVAKMGAEAQGNLQSQIDTGNYMTSVIDSILNDPSLGARTGATGMLPAVPGTAGVGFDSKVAQIQGGVFLQAYNTLKGGGQITEVEGKKAESAMARLNRAQSEQDFRAALEELKGVIVTATQRAQSKAMMGPAASRAPTAPQGGYNQQDLIQEARRRGLIP